MGVKPRRHTRQKNKDRRAEVSEIPGEEQVSFNCIRYRIARANVHIKPFSDVIEHHEQNDYSTHDVDRRNSVRRKTDLTHARNRLEGVRRCYAPASGCTRFHPNVSERVSVEHLIKQVVDVCPNRQTSNGLEFTE